tara:strand:- start:22490 stop:23029 length:540 start_codon:yes stop_codon:yes gene_type:complete
MSLTNCCKTFFIIAYFSCSSFISAQNKAWSSVLKDKVDKALVSVYNTELIRYDAITLDKSIEANLSNKLYKVYASNEFKGFVYVAQAPSMKNVFDYLVIFNKDLEIEKAKVLIYREQHGRQIGTARWLSQFNGMNTDNRPTLGKDIDGISGATISSKSMTKAINELLTSLALVKEKGLL